MYNVGVYSNSKLKLGLGVDFSKQLELNNFCRIDSWGWGSTVCKIGYTMDYCWPSGFKELRPARKISSVDKRFTAITEQECNICRFTL